MKLLLGLLATSCVALASDEAEKQINVDLRASWTRPSFTWELVEQIALENSSAYWDVVSFACTLDKRTNDRDLYLQLREHALQAGMLDEVSSASFDMGLGLHEAAPRLEAHWQHYRTEREDCPCNVWLLWNSARYCTAEEIKTAIRSPQTESPRLLPLDKIYGQTGAPIALLYIDVSNFAELAPIHTTLLAAADNGEIRYVLRYIQRPSEVPLVLSGYGVELSLKRTDYIVIDDRESIARESSDAVFDVVADDIPPLSTAELRHLGIKSSSYILQSENPFNTLLSLLESFPKYSASIASLEIDPRIKAAIAKNQRTTVANEERLIERGDSALWINGALVTPSEINAFSLVERLRKEHQLLQKLSGLGLSTNEAIELLCHPGLSNTGRAPHRFDYRDNMEEGKVIFWLNDISKDRRYASWSKDLHQLSRQTYPGQMPQIRQNLQHIVLTLDLSSPMDQSILVQQLVGIVKHKVGIRIGFVPILTPKGTTMARVASYVMECYGMTAMIEFFELQLSGMAVKDSFTLVQESNELRECKNLPLTQVFEDPGIEERLQLTSRWTARLALSEPVAIVNGQILLRKATWLQEASPLIFTDLQIIQRAVEEGTFENSDEVHDLLFVEASTRRNKLIVSEDPTSYNFVDLVELSSKHAGIWETIPSVSCSGNPTEQLTMWVVTDLTTSYGLQLLGSALKYILDASATRLRIVHRGEEVNEVASLLFMLQREDSFDLDIVPRLLTELESENVAKIDQKGWTLPDRAMAEKFWSKARGIATSFGIKPGFSGIAVNGRVVHLKDEIFLLEDFQSLCSYERGERIKPVLGLLSPSLTEQGGNLSFDTAEKLTSVFSKSAKADANGGIFEAPPTPRSRLYEKWNRNGAIVLGDETFAIFRMALVLNPISERAQKWVPILGVLAQSSHISLTIYLNPPDSSKELPIKRFYKYVLEQRPHFDAVGNMLDAKASFSGLPKDALLTLGLDVTPSWFVTPKTSKYDLDNIKLSTTTDPSIDAVYELRNILIEGHAIDLTQGGAPRGAELILGTAKTPHLSDTIIMANLGYFQFQSNPGIWQINLKAGRSQEIFNIEKAELAGWSTDLEDGNRDIAVISFTGVTAFPRLSRKPGQEETPVLEDGSGGTVHFMTQLWRKAKLRLVKSKPRAADINIFSVASGHLYERFLSIMTLSVMRHVNDHTVKFWFIENFLSPSFKEFLPHLARDQGFDYELITYKWPHWLRGQKEKQREIWGYKILFLDVMFPLDLEKVIFVDADQIVRTDLKELMDLDLNGAPYGYTPMCDDREEMEGFRFWKQGYWKSMLGSMPYHISALYVIDLVRFRQMAAGDRLRGQYQGLSADPGSLSNLDQDLPNNMQKQIPIFSLPQEWLWCETWCSDEGLKRAKTIDLCNNPLTKEPKLDRARRQIPEWTTYDDEVSALMKKVAESGQPSTRHPKDEL